MDRRSLLATAILLFAAPASVVARDQSSAEVEAAVEDLVSRFFVAAGPQAASLTKPKVIVSFTPQLSWIEEDGSEIHTVAWSQCPPELQAFFAGLLGDAPPMSPELFFREVFNAFLVPHEMSHVIDAKRGRVRNGGRLYDGELHANRVAVAFWLTQPGGEVRMERLMSVVQTVWSNMHSPVPNGVDRVAYFQENYDALLADPSAYGWYQFRLFLDAWERRSEADLENLLAQGA